MKKRRSHIFSALLIFVVFMSVIGFRHASAQTLEASQEATADVIVPVIQKDTPVSESVTTVAPKPVVKTDQKGPIIRTEKTPYGNSITITYPQNYSGAVTTSFDGSEWKTDTREYTEEDMQKMQSQMAERQTAMRKYFEEQQQFFENMWKSWPRFPVFPF